MVANAAFTDTVEASATAWQVTITCESEIERMSAIAKVHVVGAADREALGHVFRLQDRGGSFQPKGRGNLT